MILRRECDSRLSTHDGISWVFVKLAKHDFLFYIGPCSVWYFSSVKAREANGILFYIGPRFAWLLSAKATEAAAFSSTSGFCLWAQAKQEERFSLLHRPLLCVVCRQSKGSKRHSLLHGPLLCVVLVSQNEGSSGIVFYIRPLFLG